MSLLPDMVPKVLWRLEEAINKRMHLPNLDWLVFLHGIWMEMLMKDASVPSPPLTIWKQSKVKFPSHSDCHVNYKEAEVMVNETLTGPEALLRSSGLNNWRIASRRGQWFFSGYLGRGLVGRALSRRPYRLVEIVLNYLVDHYQVYRVTHHMFCSIRYMLAMLFQWAHQASCR